MLHGSVLNYVRISIKSPGGIMKTRFAAGLGIAFLALSFSSCTPKKAEVKQEPPVTDDAAKNQAADEPSLRGKEYQEVADLSVISFDLDQSTLRADARQTLQKNYETLKKHADWEV